MMRKPLQLILFASLVGCTYASDVELQNTETERESSPLQRSEAIYSCNQVYQSEKQQFCEGKTLAGSMSSFREKCGSFLTGAVSEQERAEILSGYFQTQPKVPEIRVPPVSKQGGDNDLGAAVYDCNNVYAEEKMKYCSNEQDLADARSNTRRQCRMILNRLSDSALGVSQSVSRTQAIEDRIETYFRPAN